MTQFEGIVPALGEALARRGYDSPTPVQRAVLAPEVTGADALVSAQTGSGKTVAFGLALAPTLLAGEVRFGPAAAPLGLAIAPTRELALQVRRELEWLYEVTGARIASCVGGMDMRAERRSLEHGAHIVVGTPGRLRDHIQRGALDLSDLRAVVLDEADEMLDLGFREDLEFILEAAPAERRTLMFSATVSKEIARLAGSYQRDALRINVSSEQAQHVDIEYRALAISGGDRENAIINVLRYYEARNALVFCSTRAAVAHMTARFNNRGFAVVALSGELAQGARSQALQAMRDGRARVCIATDVAARGIDLPNLELVVHADLPTNPETLLHRSGRTGRAGRKGVSILIVPHNARRRTERLLQNARIVAEWARPPSVDEVLRRDEERLLADPALTEPVTDDERAFLATLIERHGSEQVAAAFVRLHRAGRSAPEELLAEPMTPAARAGERPAGKERADFGDSVWISLSIGRKRKAEPRWLIPMLCRGGGIAKRDIGAIRMQPDETHVEIAASAIDGFLAAIGPNRSLEQGIRVTPLDGAPEPAAARPAPKPHRGKGTGKPWKGKAAEDKAAGDKPRPAWSDTGEPGADRKTSAGKPHNPAKKKKTKR